MKRYRLDRIGQLLLTRAAVHGPDGTKVVKLLVDTGSSYTILPVEVLQSTGCDPALRREGEVRLITGNGVVIAPRVSVEWFHSLGQQIEGLKLLPIRSLLANSSMACLEWMFSCVYKLRLMYGRGQYMWRNEFFPRLSTKVRG